MLYALSFIVDVHLVRRILLFDSIPSLPSQYRNNTILALLGVRLALASDS